MEENGGRPKKETTGFEKEKPLVIENKKPVDISKNNLMKMSNDNVNDNENVNVNDNEEKLQQLFIKCTSSTNLNAINECVSYLNDFPYEVIEIALKKTSEKNGGWKYAKTILQNWLKAGITTVEQVQAEELNFRNKNKPQQETEEEKTARRLKELKEAMKNETG